jgi:hypothetical protein
MRVAWVFELVNEVVGILHSQLSELHDEVQALGDLWGFELCVHKFCFDVMHSVYPYWLGLCVYYIMTLSRLHEMRLYQRYPKAFDCML